jgi:hypothetical protein
MEVAVIIQGRYSDQRVLGVVPIEEVPDTESLQKNDMRFEIHNLGEFTMMPEGYAAYAVVLKADGSEQSVWGASHSVFLNRGAEWCEWTHPDDGMYRVVLATSREDALKIVHAEWAQIIALHGSLTLT